MSQVGFNCKSCGLLKLGEPGARCSRYCYAPLCGGCADKKLGCNECAMKWYCDRCNKFADRQEYASCNECQSGKFCKTCRFDEMCFQCYTQNIENQINKLKDCIWGLAEIVAHHTAETGYSRMLPRESLEFLRARK